MFRKQKFIKLPLAVAGDKLKLAGGPIEADGLELFELLEAFELLELFELFELLGELLDEPCIEELLEVVLGFVDIISDP